MPCFQCHARSAVPTTTHLFVCAHPHAHSVRASGTLCWRIFYVRTRRTCSSRIRRDLRTWRERTWSNTPGKTPLEQRLRGRRLGEVPALHEPLKTEKSAMRDRQVAMIPCVRWRELSCTRLRAGGGVAGTHKSELVDVDLRQR